LTKQDQRFYDSFMLVLGIFIGILVGVIFTMRFLANGDDAAAMNADPERQAMVEERIRPVGRVALIGDADVGVRPVVTAVTDAVGAPLSGPQVYNDICYLCHAAPGVGGAPVLGDIAAWGPRIAQGPDILQTHVIDGYTGEAGFMPAKGGRVDLSDDEILAALEFMLSESQ